MVVIMNETRLNITYSKTCDLVFHILAHMKVNNASNLYSEKYMSLVNSQTGIEQRIKEIEEYYNNNFQKLMIIGFIPYYCNTLEELKKAYLNIWWLEDNDRNYFIKPFIAILEQEYESYSIWWNKQYNDSIIERVNLERYLQNELNKYSQIFNYFNKPLELVLSYSITRNGRGICDNNSFIVVSPFASSLDEYQSVLFQTLHEATHQFTDKLLNSNIRMDDGTHNLSEKIVMLFDYYMLEKINDDMVKDYISWVLKIYNLEEQGIGKDEFIDMHKVNKQLNDCIMELLNKILK